MKDKIKYQQQIANLYEERIVSIYGQKIKCGVNEKKMFQYLKDQLKNEKHRDVNKICGNCPDINYLQVDNSTFSRRSCWSDNEDSCQIINRCDTVYSINKNDDSNLCPKRKIHQLEPRCKWNTTIPFTDKKVRKILQKEKLVNGKLPDLNLSDMYKV